MKRKLFLSAIAIVLTIALGACGSQGTSSQTTNAAPTETTTAAPVETTSAAPTETTTEAPEETTEKAEELVPMKVGVVFSDHTNASFVSMLESGREYAEEHENVTIIEQDGKSDANTIVAALENFINSGCDVIIYQNSWPEVTDDMIREAVNAGICVCAYQTENADATFSFISPDDVIGKAIGKMAADWLKANCDGAGKVSVICNDSIAFLKARGDGMVDGILEGCPDSEFIARQPARDITTAYTVAETILNSNPEVNCWVCTSDEAAVGVSMAYEVAGWTEPIATFGCNCTAEAIEAMKEDGTFIYGSIDLQLPKLMKQMLDTSYEYIAHGTREERVIIIETTAVTRDNVYEYYPD